jgi:hypothetical protein
MNLIERYGYDRAKRELTAMDNRDIWMISGDIEYREQVRAELLEYRRANNIFEVGDKVVYKGKAGLSGLFEIETLTKTGKPKTVKTKRFGNFPCRYCEVQHATDKEIKQGYRDE